MSMEDDLSILDVNGLARKFAELKAKADEKKKELSEINAQWDEVEKLLIDAMVNEGTNSLGIEGLGLFSLRTKNYLSVNVANQPSFYQYLRSIDKGEMIRDYINPATLTAFLKEHLEEKKGELTAAGYDEVDARDKALEFLKAKGAAYFSEKQIALTKR